MSSTLPRSHHTVNAASFQFKSNPLLLSKSARPEPSAPKKKQRQFKQSKSFPSLGPSTTSRQDLHDEPSDIIPINNILDGVVIYIDKSTVSDRDQLARLANALSATVVTKWAASATHLIHGRPVPPTHRTPALVTKSLNHRMRVVAPTWLTDCHEQKKRMPETLYPYELNPNNRQNTLTAYSTMLLQSSQGPAVLAEDENPFNLTPEQYATIESWSEDEDEDPLDNNRRVTDYFEPTSNNNSDYYPDVADFDDAPGEPVIQPPDDDNNSMSYSLLEMSQAVPPHQASCESRKRQRQDSLTPSSASAASQAMERMTLAYKKETPIKHEPIHDETDDGDEEDCVITELPDIDPSKLPKKILGREERLHIWYGEQSFCLDADLTRPNRQRKPPSKLSTNKSPKKIRDYY